jgi:hypothetical protein
LLAFLINFLQEDIVSLPFAAAYGPLVGSMRHHQAKRSQWKPTKTRAVIPYPRIGKRGMQVLGRFAYPFIQIL